MIAEIEGQRAEPIVSRRFFVTRTLPTILVGSALAISCSTNEKAPVKNAIPETTNIALQPEISQEKLAKVIYRSVADMNRLFGIDLNADDIVNRTKFVNSSSELESLLKEQAPHIQLDPTGTYEAITMDESKTSPRSIILNRQAIDESLSSLKFDPNYAIFQEEYLEMLLKHELVHYSAKKYSSPELHNVVYGKIFSNDPNIKGKTLTTAYVQGADIVSFTNGDPVGYNPFHLLEEAEAFFISNVAMRARGRTLILTPFEPGTQGIAKQVDLLTKTLSRIDRNPVNTARLLINLRNQEGGREKYCTTLAKAFSEAKIEPGNEYFFCMSLSFAISKGDQQLYDSVTK